MEVTEVIKSAVISPCGKYRYRLVRQWADTGFLLPVLMLNPSTADAEADDPTIRRCLGFANREGFMGIEVINLFAFRSRSPGVMMSADDPVGWDNDSHINAVMEAAHRYGTPILCGWGTHGSFMNRDQTIRHMAAVHSAQLVCLGKTNAGQPKHPLYIASAQPFEPF